MLEFAFKYPPELFARGSLAMQWSAAAFLVAVLLIGALAALGLGYAGLKSSGRRDRAVLWTLRTALLALLLFLLLDPRLVVDTDIPVRGHVTVLIDDSLSMRIRDLDGDSRAKFVTSTFTPGAGSLAQALEQRFDTRFLRFSGTVEALAAGEAPEFRGTRSDLAQALERLARTPDADALAAIVLVTDGAVDGGRARDESVRAFRASGIPVHAIGVGAESAPPDLEVRAVRVPSRVLRGDSVEAEVEVVHRRLAGRPVKLLVEEESAIVHEQSLTLPIDERAVTLRIPLLFEHAGPRRVVFRIDPEPDEIVPENNTTHRAIDVRGDPVRVLHVEGEPRFEVKFLRRAVAADDAIRLVSLIRTAENKFYRLGIDDPDELAEGLPTSDEALFRYDAVVIGSVGTDLLNDTQQERLREFVARRGGGLVLLGGRHAFAEGGYAGSTLSGISPVLLPSAARAYRASVPVRPSAGRAGHPLLRVVGGGDAASPWERLPPLTVVNPIRQAKPGATTVLEADDGSGEPLVILASQRYGRGTVAAFTVRDSWRWQMHADVSLEDQTHEQLWRNILRHVARPAGGRVRLRLDPAEAAVGERVAVEAELLDAAYRAIPDPKAILRVTTPRGDLEPVTLEPVLERDGFHRASFVPRDIGRYEVHLELEDPGSTPVVSHASFEASGSGREFHSAFLDASRLERLAQSTGGRYFSAGNAAKVVESIDDTTARVREERSLPLWDAPAFLLALLALACLEWAWRRRRGFA